MSRLFALFVGLAVVLACVYAEHREGGDPEVHRIFYLPDEWVEYYANLSTTLYPRSYQIPTTGLSNPKFKLVSGKANVTDNGLVLPTVTTWWCVGGLCSTGYFSNWDHIKHDYYPSVANISVTDGDVTQYVIVNVTDYTDYYTYNRMSDILSQIIEDGMTQYQKLEAITRWVAENIDYGVNHTAIALMILDSGDYYAISKAIVGMAQMVGINASTRRASQDPGEYRAQNVLAIIEGRFFVADAGFKEKSKTKPREWSMYELDQGFTMNGNTLVQYDGWNRSVIIPNILNNTEVYTLGKSSDVGVFIYDIEEVYLPATLKSHASRALDYHIETLRWVEVDPLNEKYSSENGVLYMNNKTVLVLAPRCLPGSVTIHENVTSISTGAFAYRKQPRLVIPSHVVSTGTGAFFYCNISEIVIEPGIQTLGESTFKGSSGGRIVLPDTVIKMFSGPFYGSKFDEVVLSKNCPAVATGTFQESYVYKAVIPHGVVSIGGRAFYNTRNMKNVTIPNTVVTMYKEAFSSSSVKDIYFEGTEEQWNNISMVTAIPTSITVHFLGNSGSESHGDSSIKSESHGDSSIKSESHGDSSVKSESHGDSSVKSESHGVSSIKSESHGVSSIKSESHGDSSIKSESHGVSSIKSESHGDSSIKSESHGDSSIKSEAHSDSNVESESNNTTFLDEATRVKEFGGLIMMMVVMMIAASL